MRATQLRIVLAVEFTSGLPTSLPIVPELISFPRVEWENASDGVAIVEGAVRSEDAKSVTLALSWFDMSAFRQEQETVTVSAIDGFGYLGQTDDAELTFI